MATAVSRMPVTPLRQELWIAVPFGGGAQTSYTFPQIDWARVLTFCGFEITGGTVPASNPATLAEIQAGAFLAGDLLAVNVAGQGVSSGQRAVLGMPTGSSSSPANTGASFFVAVPQVDDCKWHEVKEHYVADIQSNKFSSMSVGLTWAAWNTTANWSSVLVTGGQKDAYQIVLKFAVYSEMPSGMLPYYAVPHRAQGSLNA
jgi:hypothetical protein